MAVRIVQLLLILAAAEWLWTLAQIALERQALGQPWVRMALILGTVAAVSVASAVLLGRWFVPTGGLTTRHDHRQRSA